MQRDNHRLVIQRLNEQLDNDRSSSLRRGYMQQSSKHLFRIVNYKKDYHTKESNQNYNKDYFDQALQKFKINFKKSKQEQFFYKDSQEEPIQKHYRSLKKHLDTDDRIIALLGGRRSDMIRKHVISIKQSQQNKNKMIDEKNRSSSSQKSQRMLQNYIHQKKVQNKLDRSDSAVNQIRNFYQTYCKNPEPNEEYQIIRPAILSSD